MTGIIEGTHRHPLYQAMQVLGAKPSGISATEKKGIEKTAIETEITTLARQVASLPEGIPRMPSMKK